MKKLLFFFLILLFLPLTIFGVAPESKFDGFLLTDNGQFVNCSANPALLGFYNELNIVLGTSQDKDNFLKNNLLSVGWRGFSFDIENMQLTNSDTRKWSLSKGYFFRDLNLSVGVSYNWYDSDNSEITDLISLDLGFNKYLSPYFSFSFLMRDIVLSEGATSYLSSEYRVGLGLKSLSGRLSFHSYYSFLPDMDFRDGAYAFSLQVEPIRGVGLGLNFLHKEQEDKLDFSISFSMNNFSLKTTTSFVDKKYSPGNFIVSYNALKRSSFLGEGTRCLLIDFSDAMNEDPVVQKNILATSSKKTFLDVLLGLEKAVYDPNVTAIYLRIKNWGLSFGRSEELLQSLRRCKVTGKRIIAYFESGSGLAYAVGSIADEIYLNPSQPLTLKGLGASVTFFKNLMDRIGLKAELFYLGKYKSAAQIVTLNKMTKAHRTAEALILKRLYNFMLDSVALNRNAPKKIVRLWYEMGLINPEDAKKLKIVDKLVYEKDVIRKIPAHELIDVTKYYKEKMFSSSWKSKPVIAVVHVTGSIVNGKGGKRDILFRSRTVGADTVNKAIYGAAAIDAVKGIVIRVQSGGGSVLASDKMWKAINDVSVKKPVIISMGDVAASGGYYLACGSKATTHKIYAPKTAITGSIGVITGKMVVKDLKKKLGLSTEFVSHGEHAYLFSANKFFSVKDKKVIEKSLKVYYKGFVQKVATGRNKNYNDIEKIAQGRVWTGADALRLGLIDANKSVADAVYDLARKTGIVANFRVVELPIIKKGLLQSALGVNARELKDLVKLFDTPLMQLLTGKILAMIPYRVSYK